MILRLMFSVQELLCICCTFFTFCYSFLDLRECLHFMGKATWKFLIKTNIAKLILISSQLVASFQNKVISKIILEL